MIEKITLASIFANPEILDKRNDYDKVEVMMTFYDLKKFRKFAEEERDRIRNEQR